MSLKHLTLEQQQAKVELERRNVELALLNRIITATTSAQDPIELLTAEQ